MYQSYLFLLSVYVLLLETLYYTSVGILQIKDRIFNNVPVRLYEPENREKFGGAVVYYHGGGWTVGSVGKGGA